MTRLISSTLATFSFSCKLASHDPVRCFYIQLTSAPHCVPHADSKVVYRRYASLFFVTGISSGDNELVTLEMIHRYVEVLDRYFGNVSNGTGRSDFCMGRGVNQ